MAQIWREDIVTGVDRILHVANEMGETDLMTRSRRVEMPSGLSLPLTFGMNTRLIGSGR